MKRLISILSLQNMGIKEILVHDRLRGEPGGIDIRNYWAGALHDVIKEITRNRYPNWSISKN